MGSLFGENLKTNGFVAVDSSAGRGKSNKSEGKKEEAKSESEPRYNSPKPAA